MQRKIALFVIALGGFLSWSVSTRAASLSIQPVTQTVQPGQTGGSLDVLLTNNSASSITVAAFSFEISTPDTNILFTDANTSTVLAPYIFGGGDSFFGPDLEPGLSPSSILNVLDLSLNGNGTVLNPGSTFALGHVLFDVANGATPGPFGLNFDGGASFNNLSDRNADNVAIDTSSGAKITVIQSSVPEPATLALLVISISLASAASWLRRNTIRQQFAVSEIIDDAPGKCRGE